MNIARFRKVEWDSGGWFVRIVPRGRDETYHVLEMYLRSGKKGGDCVPKVHFSA